MISDPYTLDILYTCLIGLAGLTGIIFGIYIMYRYCMTYISTCHDDIKKTLNNDNND